MLNANASSYGRQVGWLAADEKYRSVMNFLKTENFNFCNNGNMGMTNLLDMHA